MSAERYSDADVRAKPSLMAMAVMYAQQYRGEFDYMQAASAAANATGTLPIAVARGVLNCMRADPRVAESLPEAMAPDPATWRSNPFNPFEGWHEEDRAPATVSKLHVVKKPARIMVPVRAKFPFIWNPMRWENAAKYSYHIISKQSCGYLEDGVVSIRLKSICGNVAQNSKYMNVGNTPPPDFEMCGSCRRQIEVCERRYERELEMKRAGETVQPLA